MYFSVPDVLIVEDEDVNRLLMARYLQPCNYHLRFAEDGQQALDMVAEKTPDIILLDIMLPEIMGLQVLHTLRQQHSMADLPIIMVTAVDEDQRIVRALDLGANDYVAKPVNYPILIARLQSQLSLKQLSALNSEFLTHASHDLRSPIATIHGIASNTRLKLASGQKVTNNEILDDFTQIEKATNYMRSITECILDTQASGFAQIRLTKAPLQINLLINTTIQRHQAYAHEKRINLVSKLENDTPAIEVDKNRIAQVLDNLISNSIKFCSANDSIIISTKITDTDLSVCVSDTGPGLTEDDFNHLFEEDFQLSNQPTNDEPKTGLGLSVCKQLIELHDGEMNAMNNNEEGVSFWFTLPFLKLKPV